MRNLAKIVDSVFATSGSCNGVMVLIATYAFAFQIYCNFAGYSNIARGVGKCLGFDIMANFNLPYFSEFLDSVYGALYYYPALSVEAYVHGTVQFNRMTEEFADRSGMQYVDISIGIEHNSQFFLDNVHLTPKGSLAVAKNYYHALLPVVEREIAQAKIAVSAK